MIDHCLCFVSNIHTGVFYFDSEKKKKTDIIENMAKLNSRELASFLLLKFHHLLPFFFPPHYLHCHIARGSGANAAD
jgi:hypothetical protein